MNATHELLQLARLFDFLEGVLAWVKDPQGRYCWVNRAFVLNHEASRPPGMAGGGDGMILGKTDYDLSPAFLADQFRQDDERVLAGQQILNRIELVEQPEGSTTWHITHKIPLHDRSGAVVGTAGLTRPLNLAEAPGPLDSGFLRVLAQMRDQYPEKLTNPELAATAHMSLRAFERKFLASFQVTPQQYLRKLRLRMASRAIVYTTRPLVEVAQSCGFADQSHFTREFRRLFGRTPKEYREHYRAAAATA